MKKERLRRDSTAHLVMGGAHHLHVQLNDGVIVCLPQVLAVLSTFNSVTELQWKDGSKAVSQEEVLRRLLALAEGAAHRSVSTSCTALCFSLH